MGEADAERRYRAAYEAAIIGDVGWLAAAIAAGLDPNATDASGLGYSLLFAASQNLRARVVRLLLERGASAGPRTSFARAPLVAAASAGGDRIAIDLIAAGAPVDHPEGERSALSAAAERGRLSTLTALLEAGADPRRRGPLGATSMHAAAASSAAGLSGGRRIDVLAELASAGAEVDARDDDARTPLLEAVAARDADAASYLLALGAEPDAADCRGASPRSLARRAGGALAKLFDSGGRVSSTPW